MPERKANALKRIFSSTDGRAVMQRGNVFTAGSAVDDTGRCAAIADTALSCHQTNSNSDNGGSHRGKHYKRRSIEDAKGCGSGQRKPIYGLFRQGK